MTICSYLVIPEEGETHVLADRLNALSGCEAVPALNHDVLLLVTETETPAEDAALRDALGQTDGLRSLVLTFGELSSEVAG